MKIWRIGAAISVVNHKNVELYHKFKPVDGGKQVQAACTLKIIYQSYTLSIFPHWCYPFRAFPHNRRAGGSGKQIRRLFR